MNAGAMATRLSVLSRALPLRVLVVSDDPAELALYADRFKNAGFEVARASDGASALEQLDRQWFPLLITTWRMTLMDGLSLTSQLRDRGVNDTYVIMLTPGESADDYERGYLSGVDDYLIKDQPEAELFARVHVAFSTLALRRSLQEAHLALENNNHTDDGTGAVTPEETRNRLNAELRRAQRYGRQLTILTVGVDARAQAGVARPDLLRQVVQAMRGVVRTHVDWVGKLETSDEFPAFVVALPEAGVADGPAIKSRLSAALAALIGAATAEPVFSFGLASLDRGDEKTVEVDSILGVAGQCRVCPGRSGAAQLSTVQLSVSTHVAIACRHGYVVDSNCALKPPL